MSAAAQLLRFMAICWAGAVPELQLTTANVAQPILTALSHCLGTFLLSPQLSGARNWDPSAPQLDATISARTTHFGCEEILIIFHLGSRISHFYVTTRAARTR